MFESGSFQKVWHVNPHCSFLLMSSILYCESVYPLTWAVFATSKSRQSCPTLHNPIDDSPPGSSVPGILQARTLEWVAISFSNAWKWKVKVKSLSRVWPSATPWTAAHQAPLSMGFSRQEYWSGVTPPSPKGSIPTLKSSSLLIWLKPFQVKESHLLINLSLILTSAHILKHIY